MTAPSNANTSGLETAGHVVWWKAGGVNYYPEGEAFTVSESYRVEPLVTAASAQARIGELESRLEYLRSSRDGHAAQAHAEFEARVAAEARADRLAEGIVQAEILIDDAIKGIQTAPLSVVTDTIWTADPCPMTVVEALQLARAALQQETQP